LILNRKSSVADTRATMNVHGSTTAALPNCHVTAAIKPSEATFTPSRKAPAHGESRRRGMSGLLKATKTKEGRQMPRVANSAAVTLPIGVGPPRR